MPTNKREKKSSPIEKRSSKHLEKFQNKLLTTAIKLTASQKSTSSTKKPSFQAKQREKKERERVSESQNG